jgi:hypothetical protein
VAAQWSKLCHLKDGDAIELTGVTGKRGNEIQICKRNMEEKKG